MMPTYVVFYVISLIVIITAIIVVRNNLKSHTYSKNIKVWNENVESWIPFIKLHNEQSFYLMKETYDDFKRELIMYPSYFKKYRKYFKTWEHQQYIPLIISILDERFHEQYNQVYISKEIERDDVAELLNNIDGKSLDMQQREIVVSDERNTIVVAGAGSRKTLTISAKVTYLNNILDVRPEEVLLITFTNKATEEMIDRIRTKLGVIVNVYTFHRFGLNIITENLGYKPTIAPDDTLSKITSDFLEEKVFVMQMHHALC